jgi:hypothetical protein
MEGSDILSGLVLIQSFWVVCAAQSHHQDYPEVPVDPVLPSDSEGPEARL